MPDVRPVLTLAHSPDADDVFMWWPLTGRLDPRTRHPVEPPPLETGRFRFRAEVADIETLNARACDGGAPHDVTALSARAYAEAAGRYALTAAGGSFGEGYGPRVVCRADSPLRCEGCLRAQRPLIAVPGRRTTAFLLLGLLMGGPFPHIEMPSDRVLGEAVAGRVGAALVIHEGQLAFADAGLRLVVDLGTWWKEQSGLPLPLGVNAVRRDLDDRFGAGSLREVAGTLARSIAWALEHRPQSLEYAAAFAANLPGNPDARRDLVARYVDMYVNARTLDMGAEGREALHALLRRGAAAGLCPLVPRLDVL